MFFILCYIICRLSGWLVFPFLILVGFFVFHFTVHSNWTLIRILENVFLLTETGNYKSPCAFCGYRIFQHQVRHFGAHWKREAKQRNKEMLRSEFRSALKRTHRLHLKNTGIFFVLHCYMSLKIQRFVVYILSPSFLSFHICMSSCYILDIPLWLNYTMATECVLCETETEALVCHYNAGTLCPL